MRRRPWFGLHPRATLCRLLLLLVLAWITRQRVWSLMLISGDSMLPTLHGGQIVGINKLAYCVRPPERGDIVAIWTGEELIVKRIVGLPGEEIALRDGTLYVNGSPLHEPYVKFNKHWTIAPGKISAGRFVVVGDNRPHTLVAVVSRERIVGRLIRARVEL